MSIFSVDAWTIAFSPNSRLLASKDFFSDIFLDHVLNLLYKYNLMKKKLIIYCLGFSVDAWTIAFSPDSRLLASGSHTGKVNLFGIESGKIETSLDTRGKFTLSIAYVRIMRICNIENITWMFNALTFDEPILNGTCLVSNRERLRRNWTREANSHSVLHTYVVHT